MQSETAMRHATRQWIVVFSLLTIVTRNAPAPAADPGSWKAVRSFLSTTGNVTSVALAPDGDRIAVCATMYFEAGEQNLVMLCSASATEEFSKLGAHLGEIRAAVFSPDGSMLATTGNDKTVRLWDVNLRKEVQTLPLDGRAVGVAFTTDGKRLIAAGKSLSIWSLPMLERVLHVPDVDVSSFAVAPDNSMMATGERLQPDSQAHVVRLRSLATGEVLHTFEEPHRIIIYSLAFSVDGRRLVSGSWDGTGAIWDLDSGKRRASLAPDIGPIFSVTFSPDGSLVSLGNWERPLQLWSAESGQLKFTLGEGTGRSAAFSSDGGTLVTTGSPIPAPDRAPLAEVKVWRFEE